MLDSDPPTAGDKLLRFFHRDPLIAAEELLRCRQALIRRFAVERCHDAEDMASKTFERVVEALEKNPDRVITNIWAFISGVARNLIHETRRSWTLKEVPLDEISLTQEPRSVSLEELELAFSREEDLWNCFKQCLNELSQTERETLVRYYDTELHEKLKEVRERMALSMGLSSSQLRKRTFNLRMELEACINDCLTRRNRIQESS